MKTIFLGGSKYVIPILNVLKNNFELSLVITPNENSSDPVIDFCAENKIDWISSIKIDEELIEKTKSLNAKFAVLANFGLILPQEFLNIFPKGILNIHPSLLPQYRGPTPAQTSILKGDKITGVSLILLDNQVDHGPIISQKEEKVDVSDTSESLYLKLFKSGAYLLERDAKKYLDNEIKTTSQDDNRATFSQILTKDKGEIKLEHPPREELLKRMIRAHYPWPGVFTRARLNNSGFKIIKLLPEEKIQVEGKKPMSYKDFINGYSQGKEILKKLSLI
ncbi:methionyl-tRNA formyltransferase [Patescibacteria group bacterium]|nr:methionyl-tRNA formyltransferase [Patescibacteria group bacterium]